MSRWTGIAAGGIMLVLAAPASAQGLSVSGTYVELGADLPEEAGSGPARPSRKRHRSPPLPERFPDEGTTASGDRVIGTMPVLPGADLNVGLFSVKHLSHKELNRRRMDPVREVRAPESRVAAFSFSMRF